MMHDEEAAGNCTRKISAPIKSIKFLWSGGKN